MHASKAILALVLCAAACTPEEGVVDELDEEVELPPYSDEAYVLNFGAEGDASWNNIDDSVMGGVSASTLTYSETTMVFEGEVSTDNNGGFSQVRSLPVNVDLSMYDRVKIRLKSEGQPFSFVISDTPLFFQRQFKADLDAQQDGWEILDLPIEAFIEHEFIGGYPTATDVVLTADVLANVDHFEFISKLFEDGTFRLEVDWVAFDISGVDAL